MTPARIIQLVILVVAVALGVAFGSWVRSCREDQSDRPPEIIKPEKIRDDLPPEEPGLGYGIRYREAEVVRAGVAPDSIAAEKAEAFVASAQDSSLPAVLPEVKGTYDDGRLTLAVGDSRGQLHRAESECPEPCSFGTRGNELFADTERAIPRLLPGLLKSGAVCIAVGGAATGIAMLAKYDQPLLPGLAGLGGCVLLRIY